MCGIFGYVGTRDDAAQVVLAGLKKLEYRGYDSWGIAARQNGSALARLLVEKHTGKIGQATTSLPGGPSALGHTRWATHGGVTEANAHPHLDCQGRLAVIHNGIIENHTELRRELVAAAISWKMSCAVPTLRRRLSVPTGRPCAAMRRRGLPRRAVNA